MSSAWKDAEADRVGPSGSPETAEASGGVLPWGSPRLLPGWASSGTLSAGSRCRESSCSQPSCACSGTSKAELGTGGSGAASSSAEEPDVSAGRWSGGTDALLAMC